MEEVLVEVAPAYIEMAVGVKFDSGRYRNTTYTGIILGTGDLCEFVLGVGTLGTGGVLGEGGLCSKRSQSAKYTIRYNSIHSAHACVYRSYLSVIQQTYTNGRIKHCMARLINGISLSVYKLADDGGVGLRIICLVTRSWLVMVILSNFTCHFFCLSSVTYCLPLPPLSSARLTLNNTLYHRSTNGSA